MIQLSFWTMSNVRVLTLPNLFLLTVFLYILYIITLLVSSAASISPIIMGKKTQRKREMQFYLQIVFFFWQDDIIDDVGDFVAAAEILKERGAYKIYIMATHGLLSADAPRLIEESAIDEVRTDPPHPRENWLFMYLNKTVTQAKGEVVKGLFFSFFYGLSFVHCKQCKTRCFLVVGIFSLYCVRTFMICWIEVFIFTSSELSRKQ